MPSKPDRSIKWLILPKDSNVPLVHGIQAPQDKDELELYWAGRFVDACNRRLSTGLRLIGRSDEPGDVLIEKSDSTTVTVQVAEAVNQQELRKEAFKKRINKLVWTRDLSSALRGTKVVVCDSGIAQKVDINDRKVLRDIATRVREAVRTLAEDSAQRLIGSIQKEEKVELPGGCEAEIQLLRYAPLGLHAPAFFCWITALTLGKRENQHFLDSVKGKLAKNYVAAGGEFWLLVYSIDCRLALDEEAAIVSSLRLERNPFDKVFVLFDDIAAQIYPPTNNTSCLPEKAGSGGFFALDSFPAWGEDQRWMSLDFESHGGDPD